MFRLKVAPLVATSMTGDFPEVSLKMFSGVTLRVWVQSLKLYRPATPPPSPPPLAMTVMNN